MKRVLYTLLLMMVLASTNAMAARKRDDVEGQKPRRELQGAQLYCDTMSHDFGVVERRRSEIEHTFTIENRGDVPLIITRVVRSCSCMKAHISKRPIAVGEKRPMRVVYEVHKMPEGVFSKVVQIYSTSRDTGFAQFTIMGRAEEKSKE